MHWTTEAWLGMRTFLSRLSPLSWAAEKLSILERVNNEARSQTRRLRLDGGQYVVSSEGIWMTLTADELVELIADRYDPDFIVEILDITSERLLYAFLDDVLDNQDKFDLWENEDENGEEDETS